MRFRHIAPAGSPIALLDLLRAAAAMSGTKSEVVLSQQVASRFAVRHALPASTGRAGMTMLLRAMHQLRPERTDVVLPSYTCYSLAASVMKAGLKPRLVDINPETLDFVPGRMQRVDHSRTLAIVATNLFGVPNDLAALRSVASASGAFLIDDAAQSMGASTEDGWSGTRGDAGIFSFDKGKPASAIDGGVVVTDSDEIAGAMELASPRMTSTALVDTAVSLAKATVYASLLRPELYWLPNRLPFLGLGRTHFSTDFPLERPVPFLAALGVFAMKRLDEFVEARRNNARGLLQALQPLAQIQQIRATAGSTPSYLRLPMLLPDRQARDRAIHALQQAGFGATSSYPNALVDVPQLAEIMRDQAPEAVGGRFVAERLLTLPTHPYVTAADVRAMSDILRRVLASSIGGSPVTVVKQGSICAE